MKTRVVRGEIEKLKDIEQEKIIVERDQFNHKNVHLNHIKCIVPKWRENKEGLGSIGAKEPLWQSTE